jgi:hypothetical protein
MGLPYISKYHSTTKIRVVEWEGLDAACSYSSDASSFIILHPTKIADL